ncbi:MAG: hypothetical protein K8R90_04685 [Candidatus Cloacimonetes bacterium]|nr:hypothetical protein [Candidatus Cloacimonadota bacterium]
MRLVIPAVFLAILTVTPLAAFQPAAQHFASPGLWHLYQAWLENGGMYTTEPASLTSSTIDMQWKSRYLRRVDVRFEVVDGSILRLREKLPPQAAQMPESVMVVAEQAWFALQARSPRALEPLLEAGLSVKFADLDGGAAADSLLRRFPDGRLLLLRLDATIGVAALELRFVLPGDEPLLLTIPADAVAIERFRHVAPMQATRPANTPPAQRPVDATPARGTTQQAVRPDMPMRPAPQAPPYRPLDTDVRQIVRTSADLEVFVERTWDRALSRELLQNKVKDVGAFLSAEFPEHDLCRDGEVLALQREPGPDSLRASLRLRRLALPDGIDIVPDDACALEGGFLTLPDGERIDLSALSASEAALLAPHFVQLLYLHRSLGTRLLDFLLLPDVVATTLVVKGEERRIYEPRNYFQSLLLLGRWWQGRTVYFSIRDVKKVNSHVEFRGYLLAQSKDGRTDYSEIRFHLNDDYRLDLAMMFLYPDIEPQE